MSLLITLGVVGLAVLLTPLVTRVLGRQSGWPLAVVYLIAAATLLPSAQAVLVGETPSWRTSWVPQLGVEFALKVDGLTVVFGYIALLIGAVVFVYSTRYLEPGRQLSFYLVMAIFTLSMLLLVMANDLVLLFISWELTSIASFLLIARSGHSAEGASMRTLLLTFLGGLFLLAAVVVIWAKVGATSLDAIWANPVWTDNPSFTTTVGVLVALAAFSKSAQFPFHVWLPDAMAAITPVSAYLHAAAVVKAGIFLLLRFSPLFHHNFAWNSLTLAVGLFTTCLGAWFALQQTDIKRLMAYSTVSQLGLIVATIGVGTEAALTAAVFHTIAHALFKSGLFMMVGVVDHGTGTRDLRRMPNKLYKAMPASFAVTLLGCAAMAGVPPMLGFASKEAIFTALTAAPGASWTGWAALVIAALGAVITFSYCAKLVLGVFFDGPIDDRPIHKTDPLLLGSTALPILASVVLVPILWMLDPIVAAGATASWRESVSVHLALWHGLTIELGVTVAVLMLGALIAWRRRRVFAHLEANQFPFNGAAVIARITQGLRRAGMLLDSLVSGESATRHVLPILGSLVAIAFGGILAVYRVDLPASVPGLSQPIDAVLLVLISVAVFSVCRSRSRLAATVSLSAVGILATVQILSLGAPDVALTQLLVETLTIIVIMLVLQKLPLEFAAPGRRRKRGSFTVSMLTGAAFAGLAWALNGRRERSPVAQYYIDQTEPLSGGHNIVNVILVEFRALDTLGELAVLGMAGVAILAVLSTIRHVYLDPPGRSFTAPDIPLNPDPESSAWRAINVAWPNVTSLQLMLRFINPVLAVISIVLFLRGHNDPGGGFIAALVACALIGLTYLSTSIDRKIGPARLPLYLIGGGIATAVLTGVVGLVGVGSFLEPLHGKIFGVHLTTSMVFDLGVYMAVVGLMMVAFNLLGTPGDSYAREATRERTDETVEGELAGPLDTVRGERRVAPTTTFLSDGEQPAEVGR